MPAPCLRIPGEVKGWAIACRFGYHELAFRLWNLLEPL